MAKKTDRHVSNDGKTRPLKNYLRILGYIRELPSRNINPEAYALAYCLTRVVNDEYNGTYNQDSKILKMPNFAMPFMLYRVLLMECMAFKKLPRKVENDYVFENISVDIIKQLNRILCNSIKYE